MATSNLTLRTTSTLLALGFALAACKPSEDAGTAESKEAGPEAAGTTGGEAEPETKSEAGEKGVLPSLAAWLDPDAGAAAFVRKDLGLDPAAVAVVFAIPPDAEKLLEAPLELDESLDFALPEEGDTPWLGSASLVFKPQLATGAYVLRPIARSNAEFAEALEKAGMSKNEVEGFDVYFPSSATFEYKCVLLDEGVAGFFPRGELGTGLGPFTAGRDLPASELESQMLELFAADAGIVTSLHAGGPMLHLDVEARIMTTQFALRELGAGKGVEGQIVLAPMGDVDETANGLEARLHPEENHQIQGLIKDVAFLAEGEVVRGRLEMPPDRLRHLER